MVAEDIPNATKAAIVYHALDMEGAAPPLDRFGEHARAQLSAELGKVSGIGEDVRSAVIDEFVARVAPASAPASATTPAPMPMPKPVPLPGPIPISLTDIGAPSSGTARSEADPWTLVASQTDDALVDILKNEAPEVAAIVLSKLKVARAADLLGHIPGALARRIAHSVSLTHGVAEDIVALIGTALVATVPETRAPVFEGDPVKRVGAILNSSRAVTRKEILDGLDASDPGFAEAVRRSIFTFANIATRVEPRDVPRIVKRIDPVVFMSALMGAREEDELQASADFLLAGISQRLRDSIEEEMAERPPLRSDEGENAMSEIVALIREMEAEGELYLLSSEG